MKQISKSADKQTKKVIINRIADIPAGISLVLSTLVAGTVVPEGTPVTAPVDGKRTVCKSAKLLAGSTTTVMRVESATNQFKTGDIAFQVAGGAAYAGTVAREAGTVGGVVYDTITVGTALESAAEGTVIYQSSVAAGEGADTGALENTADAILKEAFEVPSGDHVIFMADAFIRADVLKDAIGALYLATMNGIGEVSY